MEKFISRTFEFVGFLCGCAFNVFFMFLCAFAVYFAAGKGFGAGGAMFAKAGGDAEFAEKTVVFASETSVLDAGAVLAENGLVRSAYLYYFENLLKGSSGPYGRGVYTLNSQMDSSEINRTLRAIKQTVNEIKITVPEGKTVAEIARYLETEGIIGADEFITCCNEGDFRYPFLTGLPGGRRNRLEGYLFPDTYFLSESPTAAEIIDKMLYRFSVVYDWECEQKARELGLTTDQVVIMASIIEKEIMQSSERAFASAVIFNRLDKNIKLEMCSTVIYALDKRKDRLLDEDLQVDSPYNTYKNAGLPAGPIANPGYACIEAALNPAEVPYLYFVVKSEETGEHVFTDDYNEFLNAKIKYNQKF